MSKRLACAVLIFAATAAAQPYVCTPSSTPVALRSNGIGEYLADYVVTCTDGVFGDVGLQNVTLTLNANITSKLDNAGFSEATLLTNEPGPGNRVLDGNTFKGLPATPNTIVFTGVNVQQPGIGRTLTYRFTNIRVNAAALAPGFSVTALISTGPNVPISISAPPALGIVQQSNQFDIRTCDDSQSTFVSYLPSVAQNAGLVNLSSTTGSVGFNVRFLESFSSSFRQQVLVTQSPSLTGVTYNTESGFIDTTVLDPGAGVASQATRLLARFSGVPAGVHLFVTTQPLGPGGASSYLLSANLIATDANGAGPTSLIAPTGTANCSIAATSAPMVEIPVVGGAAQAVWEVSGADPVAIEKASFGVVVAYLSPPQPANGIVTATGNLAPISTILAPSITAPVPRFTANATGVPAFGLGLTPLSILTATPLPPGQAGLPYSLPFTASGGVPQYAWQITGPGTPPGLALSLAGTFSGTPTTPGDYTSTVQLNDQGNNVVTKSFSITILPAGGPPTITTASPLPSGQVGSAYSLQMTQVGINPPLAWANSQSASLPPGLTLSSSGLLSGIPIASGTFNFNVSVASTNVAISQSTSKSFSLTMTPQPIENNILITTKSIANGAVGAAYSQTVTATGGIPPYTWTSESGGLPPGISLSGAGVLSGKPTKAGAYQVIIKVVDARGSGDGTAFSMIVTGPPLAITTTSLPAGTAGNPYSGSVQATGGVPPYAFSIASGALPAGLSIAADGSISGKPTIVGSSSFTVLATDALQGRDTHTLSIAVGPNLPSITTESLPSAAVGAPYSQTVAATGGLPPYSFNVASGSLPSGLSLNTNGIITGTPATGGDSTFILQVTDQQKQTGTKQFTLKAGVPLAITTATPITPPLTVGTASSITLAAAGGTLPYSWNISSGSLPAGFSLDATSGAITGTPAAVGSYSFTATVTDATKQTASRAFSGRVSTLLRITTGPALPAGVVGTAYSQSFAATGGTPPYRWTADNMPAGVTFSAAGVIGGTPTSPSSSTFSVSVTDADGQIVRSPFSISVSLPQVSGVTVRGVADASPPAQQPKLSLAIGSPFPTDISGTMTLSFASDAAVPSDDPSIQFSTGGRTVPFTIPAGSTEAVFRTADVAVQTGTVSGVISITTAMQSGGATVDCNCNLTTTIRIAKAAPVISSIRAVQSGNTITITIIGFSTSREITQSAFQFTAAPGSNIQTTSFTLPVTSSFTTWYQSTQSTAFGSQFLLTVPFTVQGNQNAVTNVSVTLTNAQGTSQPATAPVQ